MSNPNRISPVMPMMIGNDSVICDFHHGLCLFHSLLVTHAPTVRQPMHQLSFQCYPCLCAVNRVEASAISNK